MMISEKPPISLLLLGLLLHGAAGAGAGELRFRPAGAGFYELDTGVLRGRLKVDGKYQGVYPLYDVATGIELTHAPGMFSPYHVFVAGGELGVARDWPTTTRLLPDGAVEVRWPPNPSRRFDFVAVYRLAAPDTLDFTATITPEGPLPKFELFLSSYLTKALWFKASVYVPAEAGEGRLAPVADGGGAGRQYVMFPRDQAAAPIITDGRWKGFVDWEIGPCFAAPLMVRREPRHGFTAVMMAPPADCFAISCPWNPPATESNVYRSFYQSLFGYDLKPNEPARATCRLIVGRNLSEAQILGRSAQFLPTPVP